MNQQLKKKLYMACECYLQLRFDALKERLDDINESLASETKSSAGDKYETGRAMLHLEKEKQIQININSINGRGVQRLCLFKEIERVI